MLASAQDWRAVVMDGALKDRGMIGFARFLTPAEAEDIRAFVRQQARKLAASQMPAPTQPSAN
jgi:quinohemoprotein ethanol dehydrogenase